MIAAQRLARELDQMIGHEAHGQHRIDPAAAQGVSRGAPECTPIVGLQSNLDQHIIAEHGAAPQVRPGELAAGRRFDPLRISSVDLVTET